MAVGSEGEYGETILGATGLDHAEVLLAGVPGLFLMPSCDSSEFTIALKATAFLGFGAHLTH
jgi:hypothetical protein